MIDGIFTFGLSTLVGLGAVAAGYVVGDRRGRERGLEDATTEALAEKSTLLTKLDVAERKARSALAEAAHWKSMSLAGASIAEAAAYEDRIGASEAERLVSLARTLVLVDDAVIAEFGGLSLSREAGGRGTTLAALAAPTARFTRALREIGVPVAQVGFESFAAEHVVVRPLGRRSAEAFFVAATTSQPMSPLAVDAIVQAASRADVASPAPTSTLVLRGATEVRVASGSDFEGVFTELGREVRGNVRGVLLGAGDDVVFASVCDGPADRIRRAVHAELDLLRVQVERLARSAPLARIVVTMEGGTTFSWSALAPSSDLSLTFYGECDGRVVDRVAGRLRRLVGERALSAHARRAA